MVSVNMKAVLESIHQEGTALKDLPFDKWYVLQPKSANPWFYKRITEKQYLIIMGHSIMIGDRSDDKSGAYPVTDMDIDMRIEFKV